MRPAELHRSSRKPRSKGEICEGLRYVLSKPVLWISFVMLIVIQMLSYNFNVTLPLFVTHSLHSSVGVFTIMYSIFSFGAVVSALVIANRGLVRIGNIIFGAAMLGITMLLLSVVPSVGVALPVIFFVGTASVLYLTASTAIAQVETKHDMVGRVLALQTVILGGGSLIGGPLLGWLADTFGARSPMILGGAAALLAAGFGYLARQRFIVQRTAQEQAT
jgi:MFS family permease